MSQGDDKRRQFHARLDGDVHPHTLSVRQLFDLVARLDKIARLQAGSRLPRTPSDVDGPGLSLVGIEDRCAELRFAAIDPLAESIDAVTAALAMGETEKLAFTAQEELFELSTWVTRRAWSLRLWEPNDERVFDVTISEGRPVPKPNSEPFDEATSIFGEIVRVGGKKPKAHIRLLNGSLFQHVVLTAPQAQDLAAALYRHVGLHGVATRHPATAELLRFRVREIQFFDRADFAKAMAELRAVVGDKLDGVDFIEHLKEMRGDD